ncbi:hypothetical protein B0H19DRAFT_1086721 [Mycena capillaripes]|nr:hypothetical protein B0H19DRAFT_1086721 [Mycena capillaripes]
MFGIIAGASASALLLCGLGIWATLRRRRLRSAQTKMAAVAAPFGTWRIDQGMTAPPPPSPVLASEKTRRQAHKQSQPMSFVPSPTTSPLIIVRELPPPYADPRPRDGQF